MVEPIQFDTPWGAAREAVLPHVRDRFFLEVIRLKALLDDREPTEVPHRRLTDHLCVVPVLAGGNGLELITADRFRAWGVTVDDALRAASDNLARATAGRLEPDGAGVYRSPWQDSFDADRILVDDLFRGLDIRGEPVVMLPARSSLLVADSGRPGALARALEAAEAVAGRDHPISSTPVVRRWPGFEPLALESQHPAFVTWRRLCLMDQLLIYEPQRALLQQVFSQRGEDLRVARYRIMEDHETGELETHCVWSRGVRTLLPRASRVALHDRAHTEAEGVVALLPWQAIEAHCGDLLQATDHYPERYVVESFPTGTQIERMTEEFGSGSFFGLDMACDDDD